MGIFSGIANASAGRKTKKEGKKLYAEGLKERDEVLASRQDFQFPEEVMSAYGLAKATLAGKSQVQEGLERSADRTLANNASAVRRYATSGADALAAIAGVNQQANSQYNDAAIYGAQEKERNRGQLYDQASQVGQYRKLQYDLNVMMPYLQRLQFANDKVGAGLNMKLAGRQQQAQGWGSFGDGLLSAGISAASGGLGGAVGGSSVAPTGNQFGTLGTGESPFMSQGPL